MKSIATIAGALALAALAAAPALAQQAGEQLAAPHDGSGGQCAVSQAMLAAIEANKQRHIAATRVQIDELIDQALAASRAAEPGGAPVIMGKRPAGG